MWNLDGNLITVASGLMCLLELKISSSNFSISFFFL